MVVRGEFSDSNLWIQHYYLAKCIWMSFSKFRSLAVGLLDAMLYSESDLQTAELTSSIHLSTVLSSTWFQVGLEPIPVFSVHKAGSQLPGWHHSCGKIDHRYCQWHFHSVEDLQKHKLIVFSVSIKSYGILCLCSLMVVQMDTGTPERKWWSLGLTTATGLWTLKALTMRRRRRWGHYCMFPDTPFVHLLLYWSCHVWGEHCNPHEKSPQAHGALLLQSYVVHRVKLNFVIIWYPTSTVKPSHLNHIYNFS